MSDDLINKQYKCKNRGFCNAPCDDCMSYRNHFFLNYRADVNAKARAYRIQNKEAINIRERQYYIENKEAMKAKSERYKLNNKEAITLKDKQYYVENRESLLEHNKEYRIQNKERIELYNQKRIECVPCGIDIRICSKARHCKTKMHQHNLIQLENINIKVEE